MDDIFNGYGAKFKLKKSEDFLKVRETLTRMGIASYDPNKVGPKGKSLIQSCHVLHKQSQYAIFHFKELFMFEGRDTFVLPDGTEKKTIISPDDIQRRNTIACLLDDWGLIELLHREDLEENRAQLNKIKIISAKEKDQWELVVKHSIGRKKKFNNGRT